MDTKFKDKKVLIFGLGLNQGGVGSALFFAKNGAVVKVTDLKRQEILQPSLEQLKKHNISYSLSEHKYEDIDWADLIIKNPAIKPGNSYIEYAQKQGKLVETDMGIFLQYAKPEQIIGITGTKGKSTTASLIYEMLKQRKGVKLSHLEGGIHRHLLFAGNIGKSVLDTIPYLTKNSLVVLEISSFQLEAFDARQVSPKWAIITNITPDHLNYYKNMDEYVISKKIIGKYQTKNDFLFIRRDNPTVDQSHFLAGLKGQIIRFSKDDLPTAFKPKLLGQHNLENIAAAYQVGKVFNINPNLLFKTLASFKGVPFRMELIKVWNGVKIYNDTTATSPEAGIKAIETLPGSILICGGMNKSMDYTKYATAVAKFVKKVFFLEGDSTEEIQRLLKDTSQTYNDLEKLLTIVKKVAKPGDTILFSPAATSFNLFQNEFDRGRQFNQAVKKVFNNAK